MQRLSKAVLLIFAGLLCISLLALRSKTRAQDRRYHLDGTVVSIDKAQKRVVVDHKEIAGFMVAMTMPYPVVDEQTLSRLTPGDVITADVVATAGRVHLENVVVVKKSTGAPPLTPGPGLHDAKMMLPKDFRQWVFLTSGFAMTYDPNGSTAANPQFDNVFVNPAAYEGFLQAGTWPDKTILVLERRASDSKLSINKNGRVQTNLAGVEVHVKDVARGGWAFYAFDRDSQQGVLLPENAGCNSCHQKNGAVDSTFVQFYPTLIDIAKRKGTFKNTPE